LLPPVSSEEEIMPNTVRHPERQDVYSRVTGRIIADLAACRT
jgi:antirestriction protein ArdC